jgi:hypothetical protein
VNGFAALHLDIPNMRKCEGPQLCYCTYHSCNSKLVDAEDWLLHNQLSEAIQLQALESEVAQIALIDAQPLGRKDIASGGSSHCKDSSNASHLASPTSLHTPASGPVQPLSIHTSNVHTTLSSASPSQTSNAKEIYQELYRLDAAMHDHLQTTTAVLEEWSHGNKLIASFKSTSQFLTRREAQQFLLLEASWLQDVKAQIKSTKLYGDAANALLRTAIIERAGITLAAISSTLETWAQEEEGIASSPDFYSTGEFFLKILLQHQDVETQHQRSSFRIHFEP